MTRDNAIWLYNEVMSPVASNGESNLLSTLGAAAIGKEAPILISTTKNESGCMGRLSAADFLIMWANAIKSEA